MCKAWILNESLLASFKQLWHKKRDESILMNAKSSVRIAILNKPLRIIFDKL